VNLVAFGHVASITPEAATRLLERAAEVGLLTAHGGGFYSIHPALPWFFRELFQQRERGSRERALRAYVGAMCSLGNECHNQYGAGNRDVIGILRAEEPNLLHARALATQNGWWLEVIVAMQGLRILYDHTGRGAEWARLVGEIVPEFVDLATEGPLAGREDVWGVVTGYRVKLAREARRWDEAERLHRICVEWDRRRARDKDRRSIRTLAVSLLDLGQIWREMGRSECVGATRESFELALGAQDRSTAGRSAFNLGNAYLTVPALRDLDEAERWYRKSLDLRVKGDRMSTAMSLGQMGLVAYERFREALASKKPEAELRRHLNDALRWYREALEMTPTDAVGQLAAAHNGLGIIYNIAGDLDRALDHYRESIRLQEAQGNLYGAAEARRNVAITLEGAGRFADARQYAEAALLGFQTYGAGAADRVQDTLALISRIAKAATA
jgi:tetratricopeptide (TPR) repeat protein